MAATVSHSDDFLDGRNWEQQLLALEAEIVIQETEGNLDREDKHLVFEGTGVARLLNHGYSPELLFYCVRNGQVAPAHRGINAWVTKYTRAFQRRYPERVFVRVMPPA